VRSRIYVDELAAVRAADPQLTAGVGEALRALAGADASDHAARTRVDFDHGVLGEHRDPELAGAGRDLAWLMPDGHTIRGARCTGHDPGQISALLGDDPHVGAERHDPFGLRSDADGCDPPQ
jgi:hypothetical protein